MTTLTLPHRFTPRPYQLPALKALDGGAKRCVAVWHRRSGKEKTFLNYTAKRTAQRVGSYYYFFPTFAQGRKALWDGMDREGFRFMDHFPAEYVVNKREDEMKLTLANGSIFQIIGSDNIDSVMSTNPVGCVFAEYSLQDPRAWDYMRPILKENGGWAIFDFTPRGRNHGYVLYELARKLMAEGDKDWFCQRLTVADTGILTEADIEAERREGMDEDMIRQEYYCSFEGVQQGSIFGRQITEAEQDKRITGVPWQPVIAVDTWSDIGSSDAHAIWFTQNVGREVHVIDYEEITGGGPEQFAQKLQTKPYVWGQHNGPHDLDNKQFAANGQSSKQVASKLGIHFRVVDKLPKLDQRNAARAFFKRCWFDAKKCERGLDALKSYHFTWDEKRKCFSDQPYHDWSSNGADAFQYLATGHKFTPPKQMNFTRARPMQPGEGATGWMGA